MGAGVSLGMCCWGHGIAQWMLGRPLMIRISNVVCDSPDQTLEKSFVCRLIPMP